MRVNLLKAHGSPTRYRYEQEDCRCAWCRAGKAVDARGYYEAKRGERLAYAQTYQEQHSDCHRAASRAYSVAHPDQRRAYCHASRARRARAPGTHTAADIAAQYLRQHGRCYWCGKRVGKAYHVDHVIPLSKGGGNGPENLVVACPKCNLSKWAKMPHEFSGRLC